jgi:hypothetical protein
VVKRRALVLGVLGLFGIACSRTEPGAGLAVSVIRETRVTDPFGGLTVARAPAQGARVYLAPAGTPKRLLATASRQWPHETASAKGLAAFDAVRGAFDVLVDGDGDGRIDARVFDVAAGTALTVTLSAVRSADAGDTWFEAKLDAAVYAPGAAATLTLHGYAATGASVQIEIWNESGTRSRVTALAARDYAGDVTAVLPFTVGAAWPETPANNLGDYLAIPLAGGRYFTGARFSVRKPRVSVSITGASLIIAAGAARTTTRRVSLLPAAQNASQVAFSEDAATALTAPRLVFQSGVTYDWQLTAPGDGVKTVYAVFFDGDGNYAGPVSDSIVLDTAAPPLAVTGATLAINHGAPVTLSTLVRLQPRAFGATWVAFAADVTSLAASPLQYPYRAADYGWLLAPGNGVKVVWAQFYDDHGLYAPPVSATIRLEEGFPLPPDGTRLYVVTHPPGSADYLGGVTGAVAGGDAVAVYNDRYRSRLLASGAANADGSFGPWSIGDGSAGNVEKPADLVYVERVDMFDRRSAPAAVTNDSTPPDIRPADLDGYWVYDTKGRDVGNPGDVFQGTILIASDWPPAADIVGGDFDFAGLRGPALVSSHTLSPILFAAEFTVPTNVRADSDLLTFKARPRDAAGNVGDWVKSYDYFSIDSIPPDAVTIVDSAGGNRKLSVTWDDPNDDSRGGYMAVFTDETGAVTNQYLDLASYCNATNFAGDSCWYYATIGFGGLPIGGGAASLPYVFNLPNCHTYTVSIYAIDNGGNDGLYSVPVTERVILPPPEFEAWGTLPAGGTGSILYALRFVENGDMYELHFDLDSGPPYTYTTAYGNVSPLAVTFPVAPYRARLSGFPLRTKVYSSARALDGTCKSDYAAEMTADTDLRIASYADGAAGETIGGALAVVNDLNADGYVDFLAGATLANYVATVSGPTGTHLGTFGDYISSEAYDFPGTPVAGADIDGDGKQEFIVGSPVDNYGGQILAGSVRVYDDDYTLMAVLGTPVRGLHLGFTVANLGDITGDGKDDFAAGGFGCSHQGCSYNPYTGLAGEGPGQVLVWDGATRTLLRTHPGPLKGDFFGASILGGYDVDGDGVGDYLVGAPGASGIYSQGVYVYSGATGLELGTLPGLTERFGTALAMLPDVTGDGKPELIVGSPGYSSYGQVIAIDSATGELLWDADGRNTWTSSGFGCVVAAGGDVNGDGVPDVVVGGPPRIQNYYYGYGSAYVLDGRTGRILYELRGGSNDGAVGYAVLSPGNLNAGPRAEWAVGAPGTATSAYQAGRIYVLTTDP